MAPKILLVDIETSPLISYTWSIWQQDIGLNQIKEDWRIIAFAAKWLDSDKMLYFDQRAGVGDTNERKLLDRLWTLLDNADIVVTQNGRSFDTKKINSRFVIHGMKPPSSYKQIDTLILAKKYFGFTSNKLEYMADKINKKYKKLKHEAFAGFELWKECLSGNQKAWKEMERYNKHDVLSLEELYTKLIPWDNTVNFSAYYEFEKCTCGSESFSKNGFHYTPRGKFQRYCCKSCGSEKRNSENLIHKDKRKQLLTGAAR